MTIRQRAKGQQRSSRETNHIRPIFHYKPERVCAHVFLCMLAYYVEWHMRQALVPLLLLRPK